VADNRDKTASVLEGPTGQKLWLALAALIVSLTASTAYDLSGGIGKVVKGGEDPTGVVIQTCEKTRREIETAIDQRLVRELEVLRQESAEQRRRLDRVLEQLGRTQAILELTLNQK
jgi:hypothetical protein